MRGFSFCPDNHAQSKSFLHATSGRTTVPNLLSPLLQVYYSASFIVLLLRDEMHSLPVEGFDSKMMDDAPYPTNKTPVEERPAK